jgi:DNA helicase HerA-like ATPase
MNKTDQIQSQDEIAKVPDSAMKAIDEQTSEAGGPWQPSPEDHGAIGRTMFDTPASQDGTVTVLIPMEKIEPVPNQSLVKIKSKSDGRTYLGAIVSGPFTEPDGLRADAPMLVAVTLKEGILLPKYHGRAQVQIIGEEIREGVLVPPKRRPLPNSPIFPLTPSETMQVLQSSGDIKIGVMDGQEEVEVKIPSTRKAVLPRHTGILGTTGGGKSTTVSGLVLQFQKAGCPVILLDTEGEYTAISNSTDDRQMVEALQRRNMTPAGVGNVHIYHLIGSETSNPEHPNKIQFKLDFCEFSPHAFKEILELSGPMEDRFFRAYDACKLVLRDLGIFPAKGSREEESEALEIDEMETGYPKMTLSHLIDVTQGFLHEISNAQGNFSFFNAEFRAKNTEVMQRIKSANVGRTDSQSSWRAVVSRLWRLNRLGILDNPKASKIDYSAMLQPGRVSIIDLSDKESPQVRNLAIAQILKGIQRQQDEKYRQAARANQTPQPTMIFIEEAHEFLSDQRIKDMPVLFQQVARIARRGRKRWLGLVFISQLPQHLPDEVLGLINNWVLHKIGDSKVVDRLRKSIGGIDDSLWRKLPNLAPGQAIASFCSLSRAILTSVDPTPCKLLMVE